MSYNKTNWKSGDVVTSEKLNKMENGIADASGGFISATITSVTEEAQFLNITPNDIFDEHNTIKAICVFIWLITDPNDPLYAGEYMYNVAMLREAHASEYGYSVYFNGLDNEFIAEGRDDFFYCEIGK